MMPKETQMGVILPGTVRLHRFQDFETIHAFKRLILIELWWRIWNSGGGFGTLARASELGDNVTANDVAEPTELPASERASCSVSGAKDESIGLAPESFVVSIGCDIETELVFDMMSPKKGSARRIWSCRSCRVLLSESWRLGKAEVIKTAYPLFSLEWCLLRDCC
jgi:hypothetical protein